MSEMKLILTLSIIFVIFISLTNGKVVYKRALWEDHDLPQPLSVHDIVHMPLRRRQTQINRNMKSAELTPLYPGYGTHFSYVFVGSPPQRQTVIVDTGSHYTAFPCTGCDQCGNHVNKYWDIKNSSTATVPQCNNNRCPVTQSYSEGSSWTGFFVKDKFYIGGSTISLVPDAASYAVEFTFACQTYETGLFRTQLADGIMGMSIAQETMPAQLVKAGLADTRMFALCYRVGGGIMTLAGVDQRIHMPFEIINYAKLYNRNSWYGVHLMNIAFQTRDNEDILDIPGADTASNNGIGGSMRSCIVDSGTTDTYLSSSISRDFQAIFRKITGINFSNDDITIAPDILKKIPNLIFTFQGMTADEKFSILMPWNNYVDNVGGGKYALRLFLSEPAGYILGANFMTGYNIIFDADGGRVGFAKSTCKYEEFSNDSNDTGTGSSSSGGGGGKTGTGKDKKKPSPVNAPSIIIPGHSPTTTTTANSDNDTIKCSLKVKDACSATCDGVDVDIGKYVKGIQNWVSTCSNVSAAGVGPHDCNVPCFGQKVVRGDPTCPDTPWSECDKACLQTRKVKSTSTTTAISTRLLDTASTSTTTPTTPTTTTAGISSCKYTTETRTCYSGACPINDGDYLVFVDMKIRINPQEWSYVYSEAFYGAFATIFKIKDSSVVLLNDANNEYTNRVKLRFEMRFKSKLFKNIEDMTDYIDALPDYIEKGTFITDLIQELSATSIRIDKIDYSRYGWLQISDIEITNVVGLPKAAYIRDPYGETPNSLPGGIDTPGESAGMTFMELILSGIVLGILSILICVLYLYYRLKADQAKLEKDKVSDSTIRRIWDKFINMQGKNLTKGTQQGEYTYKQIRLEDFSSAIESGRLTIDDDTRLDADDHNANRS